LNGDRRLNGASVEKRRVQRLGASSLIITLPKKWANMLGIRVGDTVYLKLSKGHIKIIPGHYAGRDGIATIRVGKDLPVEMVRVATSCLYIMGVDEAVLDLSEVGNKEEVVFMIKSIAQELIGMDVMKQNGKLVLKVFIDKNKIDVDTILSNYKNLLLFIINLIIKITRDKKPVDRELEVVNRDLIRYQHLLLRFIKENASPLDPGETSVCNVSTGTYIGMALDALIGAAHVLNESLKQGTIDNFTIDVESILEESKEIINLMIENVLNPDPGAIMTLRKKAKNLYRDLKQLAITGKNLTRSDMLFISSMMQFARIIRIYTNVVSCHFVETLVNKDEESWLFY